MDTHHVSRLQEEVLVWGEISNNNSWRHYKSIYLTIYEPINRIVCHLAGCSTEILQHSSFEPRVHEPTHSSAKQCKHQFFQQIPCSDDCFDDFTSVIFGPSCSSRWMEPRRAVEGEFASERKADRPCVRRVQVQSGSLLVYPSNNHHCSQGNTI